MSYLYYLWKPKNILINGCEYIEYPEANGVELIHNPKCKNHTNNESKKFNN